jgi:hypothetical protein
MLSLKKREEKGKRAYLVDVRMVYFGQKSNL